MNIIEQLEQEEIAVWAKPSRLRPRRHHRRPGESEGRHPRASAGLRRRRHRQANRGLNSAFTVRKISPAKASSAPSRPTRRWSSVEVKRRGDVRRAKLYYLRERSGKSARIRKMPPKAKQWLPNKQSSCRNAKTPASCGRFVCARFE